MYIPEIFDPWIMYRVFFCRLHDVLHSDKKLTLVFEYCDQDLKKYFDSCNGEIDPDVVKVNIMIGWAPGGGVG